MSTETEAANPPADTEAQPTQSSFALLFELESIAANGRVGAFDVLKSILSDHNITLSQAEFSRYCLHPSPAHYVPRLLEALGCKISADKLAEDVSSGVVMHLSSGKTELQPGLAALLDAATARRIPIAALTALTESDATSVVSKLGLDKWNVVVHSAENDLDESFPRSDAWLKIARAIERRPRRCTAIVSTHDSSRAALSAGMATIVVPDVFTAFQDFGGADQVLDSLADITPEEILAEFFPIEEEGT